MGFAEIHASALRTLEGGGAFGEPVTFLPAAGGSHLVRGIFGMPYAEATPEGVEVLSTVPALGLRLSELEALGITPAQGDQVVVRGVTFLVSEVRPDGEGWARLPLHRVGVTP